MAAEMSAQMKSYRDIGRQAAVAEEASAKSAADAKTAAEQAAAVRADLQSKQSKLQLQIAVVKSQYTALTPHQREALAAMPPTACSARTRGVATGERSRRLGRTARRHPTRRRGTTRKRSPEARRARGGATAIQAALTPDRLALRLGRRRPERIRLLRTGDVVVPAGRYRAAALQPGARPGWAAGIAGPDAAGRSGDVLLRRVARRPSTSVTE